MFDQLDGYVRRPLRYQNIDGIWEMSLGLLWLGISLLDHLHPKVAGKFTWRWKATHLFCFGVLAAVVLYGRKVLKERVTYRRTGFVKYRGLAGKPWLTGLIAAVIAVPAGLLSYLLLRHSKYSVTAALISVMWGFLYALGTRLNEAWRWVFLAVIVVGPVGVSMLPLNPASMEGLPMAFIGLAFLVSGGIAFRLYLHRTRPAGQEAE